MWRWVGVVAAAVVVGLAGCAGRPPSPPTALPLESAAQIGIASWYGPGFHGQRTSSGEIYDQHDLTAAHQTIPLGTKVLVTNLANRRSVEVRINDRGPFVKDRVIDLSYAAAQMLDIVGPGTGLVRLEVLGHTSSTLPRAAYAVQVGAFSEYANARRLLESLRPRFDQAYIETVGDRSGQYYRVRIGPFAQRNAAVEKARLVAELGLATVIMEDAAPPLAPH